jgi:hypothetical protein
MHRNCVMQIEFERCQSCTISIPLRTTTKYALVLLRMPAPTLALALLLCAAAAAAAAAATTHPSCIIVRDAVNAQDVKLEAHGENAVRVRAVPAGGTFLDAPDVVSAFTPLPTPGAGATIIAAPIECVTVALNSAASDVDEG